MKDTIRRQMRQQRRSLSLYQQQEAAIALWLQFRNSYLFLNSKRIALYLANDGEIDPSFLAHNLLSYKRTLFLPCIDPVGSNRLQFAAYSQKTRLRPNRFGISEPQLTSSTTTKPVCMDLVLLPLVAFDSVGNRLGMGGGFYDRTFAFKKRAKGLGPKLIGLAHECQQADSLTTQSWDIPLDGILTDQRFIQL